MENAYERHAWKVLLVLFVITLVLGLMDLSLGGDSDPAISESVTGVSWSDLKESDPTTASLVNLITRMGGIGLTVYSILGIAISATAFKRGERWAWYALWSLPLFAALIPVVFLSAELVPGALPTPLPTSPVFLIVSVVALLLPYRRFFPK